jgi:hypothetical protein
VFLLQGLRGITRQFLSGQTYTTHPGSRLLFPSLCQPTAPISALADARRADPSRGLMMPRRQSTRAEDRAKRVDAEGARNREFRENPRNDCDDAYFPPDRDLQATTTRRRFDGSPQHSEWALQPKVGAETGIALRGKSVGLTKASNLKCLCRNTLERAPEGPVAGRIFPVTQQGDSHVRL